MRFCRPLWGLFLGMDPCSGWRPPKNKAGRMVAFRPLPSKCCGVSRRRSGPQERVVRVGGRLGAVEGRGLPATLDPELLQRPRQPDVVPVLADRAGLPADAAVVAE